MAWVNEELAVDFIWIEWVCNLRQGGMIFGLVSGGKGPH